MSTSKESSAQHRPLEASLSTLVLSLASNAAMALGLEPHPQSGKTDIDLAMARFNIDMLMMLQEKTKNNLNADEQHFFDAVVKDLQLQFVQISQKANI
jgi:hypothetical protein